jgi:phosphoglycerate dehydrogenase-like enzyme
MKLDRVDAGEKPRQQILNLVLDLIPDARLIKAIGGISSRLNVIQGLSREALHRAHVIFTNSARFDPADAPSLRWVQLNTAAINHLAGTPLAASNITVANVHGAYSPDVAELTIGLMLSLTRQLHVFHDMQQQSHWPAEEPLGNSCFGKTLGIVGYGSIGRHIARMASAMGMKILACKRNPEHRRDTGFCRPNAGDPAGLIPEAWYGINRMRDMLAESHVVICTLPFTPMTVKCIGAAEFAVMPRGAYFINIGRGGVVDELALMDVLRKGHLAAAALDVFKTEPLGKESPLWKLPNLVMTPHIASWSIDQTTYAVDVLIENLRRDLAGEELVNLVNLKDGY